MKQLGTWVFIAIWFFHLVVGAGAGFAAIRLWPERKNEFVRRTMIHLHAAMVDALGAIAAVFLIANVQWTWKFSIAVFAAILARDLMRVPLIFYVIRGPK